MNLNLEISINTMNTNRYITTYIKNKLDLIPPFPDRHPLVYIPFAAKPPNY